MIEGSKVLERKMEGQRYIEIAREEIEKRDEEGEKVREMKHVKERERERGGWPRGGRREQESVRKGPSRRKVCFIEGIVSVYPFITKPTPLFPNP